VALNKLVDPAVVNLAAQRPQLADGTSLPVDAETKQVTYQAVVEVPGASKF